MLRYQFISNSSKILDNLEHRIPHFQPPPDERTLKIVIKSLLRDISDTEVSEELTNLGYTVTNVRQFGKQDQKLPIHMVVLKNTQKNKGIFNLRSLFYMAIKIERYKSNTPRNATTANNLAIPAYTAALHQGE